MKYQFEKRIQEAINSLWINVWDNNGSDAKSLLEEAAKEGNGDAYFFLSQCYMGKPFINPKFGFKEDKEKVIKYLNKSIELGSAVGMFRAVCLHNFTSECSLFLHKPSTSLKEVWNKVYKMAEHGEAFCQYMIGNAYYYGDCMKMQEYKLNKADDNLIPYFQRMAIFFYEKSIENGLSLAIENLIHILSSGNYGIAKDENHVKELIKRGATLNNPGCEYRYAQSLHATNPWQSLKFYKRSALHGEKNAYYSLGLLYTFDGQLPRNLQKAKNYFEMGIKSSANEINCKTQLGKIYFFGGDGIKTDYSKAFTLFNETVHINNWCSDMLETCYLKGLGTATDYIAARKLFLQNETKELSSIGLGEIYCFGLGTRQNISLGMQHLDKYPLNSRTIHIKSYFKYTLFGWRQTKPTPSLQNSHLAHYSQKSKN